MFPLEPLLYAYATATDLEDLDYQDAVTDAIMAALNSVCEGRIDIISYRGGAQSLFDAMQDCAPRRMFLHYLARLVGAYELVEKTRPSSFSGELEAQVLEMYTSQAECTNMAAAHCRFHKHGTERVCYRRKFSVTLK